MAPHTGEADAASVLVVGAGPTGLMMAAQLARFGVHSRIVDKAEGPSVRSKALGIQARTLELLEYVGLAERFVQAGHKVRGLQAFSSGKEIVHLDFEQIGSRYNYVLVLPQAETERFLGDELTARGSHVEWQTELVGLVQETEGVRAVLRRENATETVRAPYAIGCDGPHSAVRNLIGMQFHGSAFPETFALADVTMRISLPRDIIHVFLCGPKMTGLFPLADGGWRIVVESHEPNPRSDEPGVAEIQAAVDECGPGGVHIDAASWTSRFHISQRQVLHYRKGCVFLAGDAAHIHSPLGGQGMNTGIQDACNLAWKIAVAIQGAAAPGLLDSYETERLPIGSELLRATGGLSRLVLSQTSLVDAVRDRIAPVLVGWAPIHERILNSLSEVSVAYRNSPIVANSGRRAPDATVRRDNAELRLYEAMRDPRHKLVYCGVRQLPAPLMGLIREHAAFVELLQAGNGFPAVYGLKNETVIAIRPDGYIGYIGAPEIEPLRGYFGRLFKTASSARAGRPTGS